MRKYTSKTVGTTTRYRTVALGRLERGLLDLLSPPEKGV